MPLPAQIVVVGASLYAGIMKDDRGIELASPVRHTPTLRSRMAVVTRRIGVVARFGGRGLVWLAVGTLALTVLSTPLLAIGTAGRTRANGEPEESLSESLNLSTKVQVALAAVLATAVLILMVEGVVSRLKVRRTCGRGQHDWSPLLPPSDPDVGLVKGLAPFEECRACGAVRRPPL